MENKNFQFLQKYRYLITAAVSVITALIISWLLRLLQN